MPAKKKAPKKTAAAKAPTLHYVTSPRARSTACGFTVVSGKVGRIAAVVERKTQTTTDPAKVTCGRCKRRK